MNKAQLQQIIREELKSIKQEVDSQSFIKKSEFKVEDLDMSMLGEYDMVLDDILGLINKYKFIPGLEKSIIKRQAEYEKKLVADKMREYRSRGIK